MAKNLNVNLAFTANASQAKAELNALKKSLNELVSGTALKTPDFQFTKEIQDATKAAAQLKVQLDNAINVKTGNLDLTKFNEQMNKSGMSLEKYQNQLYQLGPAGEKAFADLTRSITMADVPLRRSSKLLDELWTTMKNTARWQLTSSAMHGFMGAVSSAYHYAQDLNSSLNEIRIVTGASVDKMAEFAKEANAAAKALSTTTTEYTNASLIFYQQGLTDSQVKERTDITIKMANAAGASAEKVSDQLTAVWNNFYDGSKSLEYYADVMTALGAATASSTDEIAGGLEKFAAIGETIGLSYEYAASALATITSNTRQSEDVVGTALKTIFARIQGLNLGETLDDGTTLNKYSKALESVGISIFDSAGEMKKMDTILDEMAAKWDTLSKAQQAALAQTVAGTRQYTQLVALMDNWDNGDNDSMTANLNTSYNASGALQEQADIYAESWEAAQKRVRASTEAVYSAILNDEFFIDLTNSFADLIDGVKTFIDSLGGIKGVLLAIGSIVTSVFSKQISQGISNAIYNIKSFVNPKGVLTKEIEQKKEANQRLIDGYKDDGTTSGSQSALAYSQLGVQQNVYIENAANMSEEEQKINQILMDRNRLLADEVVKSGENLQKIEEQILLERKSLQNQASIAAGKNGKSKTFDPKTLEPFQKKVETVTKSYSTLSTIASKVELTKNLEKDSEEFKKLKINIQNVVKSLTGLDNLSTDKDFEQLGKALGITGEKARELYQNLENAPDMKTLRQAISTLETTSLDESTAAINELRTALTGCGITADRADEMMKDYLNAINQFGPNSVQATESLNKLKTGVSNLSKEMEKSEPKPVALGEAFSKAAGAVMAVGQAFSTVKGIIDVFNDSESTTEDKIMALVSGIGMLIPTILAIAPAFSTASVGATLFGQTATAAGTAASLAMWQVTLIVAAITAIIAVVALLVTRESEAERQARKTAETAESMKKAADEAKQSFEDLKSAFDAYDTAVEKLNECREGTEEWNEALKEVNNTVLDILQNSPELAKNANLFTRDKNGMLTINQDERENVLRQAERNANVTAAGAVMVQAQASKANTQLEKGNLSSEVGSTGIGNVIYTDYGPVYDQMLNAGKILTDNASDLAGLTETEYRAKVRELLDNAASDQAKSSSNYTTQIDNLVDECVTYQSQINALAQNTEEAANQMHNAALLLAEQELGDDYGAAEKTVAANQYDDIYDRIYKEIINEDKKNEQIDESTSISKNIWKRYNEAMGTNLVASKNQIQGNDNNRVYAYKGESGEETVTIEHMAATIAASEALKEMGNSAEEAATKLSEIEDKIGTENADVLKGFIAGQGFEGASQENFNNFYRNVATYNPEGVATGNASKTDVAWYVDKMFGDGKDGIISDETAKKYGYETGQAMIDAMYEQISNANKVWESMEIGDLVGFESLSMDAALAIDNAFKNISLGPKGKQAGEDFITGLNTMVEGLEQEEQQKALTQLANVDWSSWDALDKARAIMAEFGVEIDTSSAYWQGFANDMRIANNAIPDFTSLQENLQSIAGILGSLNFGDIIKDEDYEKLVAYNQEWEKFFILQADGTRKFIGDSAEMLNTTRENIAVQREDLAARKELVEQVTDSKVDWKISAMSIDKQYGDGKDGKLSDQNGIDHGYKSGEDMINNIMADQTKNLIDNNAAIKEILNNSGYDETAINAILNEARNGNRERLETMLTYIDDYMAQDLNATEEQLNEMMASTATSIQDLQNLFSQGLIDEAAYDKQLTVLANQASSLEELKKIQSVGLSEGSGLDTYEYGQALLTLAENYSNCVEEAEAYSKALLTGSKAEIKAAQSALEAAVEVGELAEKYDLNAEELEDYGKRLKDLHKDSNLSIKDATKLATANMRLDRGMSNLNDNLDDYKKALDSSNRGSAEWSNTLSDLKTDLADILNIADGSMLSDQFAEDTLASKDLKLALDGDADAILRLRLAAADDIIANLDVDDSSLVSVQEQWDFLKANLAQDIAAGGINDSQMVAAFNEMIEKGNMTKDQIEAALAGLNVSANVHTEYVPQKVSVPTTITEERMEYKGSQPYTVIDDAIKGTTKTINLPLYRKYTNTFSGAPVEVEGYVPKYTIEGTEGSGSVSSSFTSLPAPTASRSSTSSGKQSGGGGGGGSTPSAPAKTEKRDTTSKSDVSERYREVSDSIDNVTDALTRAERATSRLWGKDKLDAMRQENKILAEQYKLLQQKAQEAENYAKQDYNDLMDVADEIGISVVVDTDTGDITNIEDVEKTLYDRLAAAEAEYNRKVEAYNAAVDAAGDSPTEAKVKELETMRDALDAYEKDIIGGIEDDISAWEDAEQTFQNSVETWEDAGLEAEDILDQMMQKNFDIWSESLQLEVEVNDRDLELLDYYLSKTEDNVYQMAEAAALMVGNLNSGFEGGQLGEYLDNLSIYGEKYSELTERLNSTDPEYQITSAQYKEGLEEIQSGLLDNLSSIQELDDAMLNYYGDTLSMVGEEIDKYTEKMEHQTSILEHYANMMDILGKSQDYEAMGTILEGQVKTIQNELNVAEAEYNSYAEEAEKKRKLYEEAVANGDTAAAELYKGEWEAAEEVAMEAQSNMLDKTEQWAESMKAVVENKLQGLAKSLEEALTGGTSFDQINTQLERAASLQEEYLTTTNQIYETNKLMRTAQQAMDKSTNSVAKQRLKDFIKETDQLQDKSKLSKYELEIQQAKYDLLLAEMALEDAQNAKTTVRLQRDSEGNMGYVYTADQSQLSQAQQQLEDAQNSLYNIGLEGANSYTEKYNQTMQEMYDTLTSISEAYYNGEIASQEEYEAQMLAAQEYYYEQLENFQDLYGVALQTDTRVIKDAWSTGMGAMKVETRTWKDAVSKYTGEATETLAGWYDKVDEIAAKTGLDNIANKVNNVTTESQNLKDTILGVDGDKGVIGALKDELTAVGDLTGGYANLRTTIQGLITDYENLMKTVNNAQNQQQSDQDKNENGDGGNSGDTGTDNNPDGTTPGDGDTGDTAPNTTPGNNTPSIVKGQSVTVKTSATHFSRDGGNGTRMRSFVPGSTYTVMNFDDDEVMIGRNGVVTGWVKKTDLVGFDTGGYTGSWGSYGKMAMLHEKELVLNERDTSNFLASMEVLERILEVIDLQSMNAQLGGLLNTPSFGNNSTSQTVEQNVHIEASFPGVSDRNEIEEAFNNLINTASQYANRKF